MPQIWMTYDELAGMLACYPGNARGYTIAHGLERKRSRDGRTRVKLNSELTELFVATIRSADKSLDRAIHDLHQIHEFMTESSSAFKRAV